MRRYSPLALVAIMLVGLLFPGLGCNVTEPAGTPSKQISGPIPPPGPPCYDLAVSNFSIANPTGLTLGLNFLNITYTVTNSGPCNGLPYEVHFEDQQTGEVLGQSYPGAPGSGPITFPAVYAGTSRTVSQTIGIYIYGNHGSPFTILSRLFINPTNLQYETGIQNNTSDIIVISGQ